MTLTASDISLLREFPASTEPPRGLTTEQRRRVEDLPWGLLREGRRTDLGDDVVEMADRIAALEVEHAVALFAPVDGVDVEEVLRLDREATPAPWEVEMRCARYAWDPNTVVEVPGGIIAREVEHTVLEYDFDGASENAALIATYRTAAPALAREVKCLRAEAADMQRAHSETVDRLLEQRDAATTRLSTIHDVLLSMTGSSPAITDPPNVWRRFIDDLADLADDGKALPLFQRLVERTAAALGLDKEQMGPETGEMCLPSWHDIPERVTKLREAIRAEAALEEQLDSLKETT